MESVNTNDAKKDAEVDKQLAELLGKAMREHREREQEQFLANESEYDVDDEVEDESIVDENKEILEAVELDKTYASGDNILKVKQKLKQQRRRYSLLLII